MTLETSKKVLKAFGILSLISGIVCILLGVLVMMGASTLTTEPSADANMFAVGVLAGIIILIVGLVGVLEGVFSIKAAKDITKIMPAWIFALVGIILSVIGIITNIGSGPSSFGSSICTLIVDAIIFVAANNIKKANDE